MKRGTALYIVLIVLIGVIIIVHLRTKATGPELGEERGPELSERRAIKLQCPPAVEAQTGDNVTLPCSTKSQMAVCKDLTVEWLCWDPVSETHVEVLLVHRGKEALDDQDKRFKGKTVLLHKDPCSGNFSLQMTVDSSHSGTYNCNVEKISCSTTLTVREQDSVTPSNPTRGDGLAAVHQGMDPGTIWGISLSSIAFAGIIIGIGIGIGIVSFKKWQRKNAETNQGTGEEMTEMKGDENEAPEAGASSGSKSSM